VEENLKREKGKRERKRGKDYSLIKSKDSGLGERGEEKESYKYNTFICNLRELTLLMKREHIDWLSYTVLQDVHLQFKYGAIFTQS
jgi:hypothetical protein